MPQQVLTAGRLHRGAVDVRGGQRRRGARGLVCTRLSLHTFLRFHSLALTRSSLTRSLARSLSFTTVGWWRSVVFAEVTAVDLLAEDKADVIACGSLQRRPNTC